MALRASAVAAVYLVTVSAGAASSGACSFPDATFATDDGGGPIATATTGGTRGNSTSGGASATGSSASGPVGDGSRGSSGSASAASSAATGTSTSSGASPGTSTSSTSNGNGNGNGNGSGNGSSHGNSSTTSSTPAPPATTTSSSATTSTPTTSTASTSVTSSTRTSSMNCDVDGDGFLAKGACGGDDCNDDNPAVNPGVGKAWVYDVPVPSGNWLVGDWNCDGIVEEQYLPNTNCTSINVGALGGGQCSATTGFTGAAPTCGVSSDTFVTCQAPLGLALVCSNGSATVQKQGCR